MKNTDKMTKVEKWPVADTITVKQLKDFINTPGQTQVYRQSMNWSISNWDCVKARLSDGSWKKINSEELVVNPIGNNKRKLLLWRVRLWLIDNEVDVTNRPLWSVEIRKLRHDVKRKGKKTLYTTFYLFCKRAHHSI